MEAASFDQANCVLSPPSAMTADECMPLSVFRGMYSDGQRVVISCWKPTRDEIEEIKRTGRIWLSVLGEGMPPVALTTQNPFLREAN